MDISKITKSVEQIKLLKIQFQFDLDVVIVATLSWVSFLYPFWVSHRVIAY